MPRWVTAFGRVRSQAPRPTQPEPAVCGRLECVAGESRGSKQACRMIHQPVFVVSQCLLIPGWWLASGDQRPLTGSGSASEA